MQWTTKQGWRGLAMVAGLVMTAGVPAASAQTGYIGVFGGGPIYKTSDHIQELAQAGYTEVVVWNIEVKSNGDLNFNGEFPIVSNGTYIGNSTFPNFPADMATLKQGKVKRITFSIGSSNTGDWEDVQSLVQAQGTGSTSILYKNFAALKKAIPAVDALDFDIENGYDLSSATAFGVMLGKLGYKVVPDAYTDASFWKSLVTNINNGAAGTVDAVHLQVYSGGAGNTPCSGWSFGSVPVYPGVWDQSSSTTQAQAQFKTWHTGCGIKGGFLWLYDDIVGTSAVQGYATAITKGVGGTVLSGLRAPAEGVAEPALAGLRDAMTVPVAGE